MKPSFGRRWWLKYPAVLAAKYTPVALWLGPRKCQAVEHQKSHQGAAQVNLGRMKGCFGLASDPSIPHACRADQFGLFDRAASLSGEKVKPMKVPRQELRNCVKADLPRLLVELYEFSNRSKPDSKTPRDRSKCHGRPCIVIRGK